MNRRIRNPNGSESQPKFDRFLKPGALARIRDSKISARSPSRSAVKVQILSPPPSPDRSIVTADGSPCFAVRIYGPRLFNRKKIVASKRIFFMPSSPDPLSDSGLDVFGSIASLLGAQPRYDAQRSGYSLWFDPPSYLYADTATLRMENLPLYLNYRSILADEDYSYNPVQVQKAEIRETMTQLASLSVFVGFYILLLRAVDRFAANNNRFPAIFDGEIDEDITR